MKKLSVRTIALGLILVTGGPAVASIAPSMFTSCPQSKNIKSPQNGAGIYFSSDCSVAFVLPPRLGEISLAQPTALSNVRTCGAVENVFETLDFQSRKVSQYIKQIEAAEEDVEFGSLKDPWIDSGVAKPPEDLNPEIEKLEQMREKVTETVLKVLQWNETLATYEGPKVRITVAADHNKLVQDYQKLNPNIEMRPMPIAKSVLTFVGKVTNNIGKAPAALYMDMSGVKVPASHFTGLTAEDEDGKGDKQTVTLFSSGVSGQLVLSLVGACPFYDLRSGTFPETIETRQLTSYIAPSVDYIYNVQVNRKYIAKYNLAELLKRIQKQSTKGGFFTSSTLNSLVIDNSSTGWFSFESKSEDSRHEWDEQLAQTLKAQIIARLLARLGAKPIGNPEIPGLIAPGKTGADVASGALKICPHIYCQAAGFVLDGLSSSIGGSKSVSEFIQANNHWEGEEVSETKMVPQMGQTAFGDK